jgi:hypothetical protein
LLAVIVALCVNERKSFVEISILWKVIFFEIPNSSVEENRPGDDPGSHTVDAKRTDPKHTLIYKPDDKDKRGQCAEVYEKPQRFARAPAGEEHDTDCKKHREGCDAEEWVREAKDFTLPRSS